MHVFHNATRELLDFELRHARYHVPVGANVTIEEELAWMIEARGLRLTLPPTRTRRPPSRHARRRGARCCRAVSSWDRLDSLLASETKTRRSTSLTPPWFRAYELGLAISAGPSIIWTFAHVEKINRKNRAFLAAPNLAKPTKKWSAKKKSKAGHAQAEAEESRRIWRAIIKFRRVLRPG